MISKKKGLHRFWVSSSTKRLHYSGSNNRKSIKTSAPKSRRGGAVFTFGAIICLKSTKKVLFCILFGPMGRTRVLPAPPDYATGSIYFCVKVWTKSSQDVNHLPFLQNSKKCFVTPSIDKFFCRSLYDELF